MFLTECDFKQNVSGATSGGEHVVRVSPSWIQTPSPGCLLTWLSLAPSEGPSPDSCHFGWEGSHLGQQEAM